MTTTEPLDLYLDVDGVINALSASPLRWPETFVTKAGGMTIRYAPALIERLRALTALPHVQAHWLTTWHDDAPRDLAPVIGLGADWPVLGTLEQAHREPIGRWWKAEVVADYWPSRGRRAVWVDDDLRFDPPTMRWIESLPEGRLLGVCPPSDFGLTPTLMDRIEDFARR